IWCLGLLVWGWQAASAPIGFATATLLNLALRWLISYSAAASLSNRRSDGSYELLLTTPIHPAEIVWGNLEALQKEFQGVGRVVLSFQTILMVAGLAVRSWSAPALFVYLVVWGWLQVWAWRQAHFARAPLLAMWAGLNSGRAAHAAWRVFGLNFW